MITHSKDGIYKPKSYGATLLHTNQHIVVPTEPSSWQEAKNHPFWLAKMQQELQAFRDNQTWDLVPRT